MIKSLVMSP